MELEFHFGTAVGMTDYFTFLVPKKTWVVPKRVLDKTFILH